MCWWQLVCTYDSWLHRCRPCSQCLHHTSISYEYTLQSGTAFHWMNTWQVASGDGHNERETHLIGPAGDRDQIKNCQTTNYKISSFWWGNGSYLRWYDHVNENAWFAPLYFNQHSVCESFSIWCSLAVVNTFSLLALSWQGACHLTKDFKISQEWKIRAILQVRKGI